MVKSLISDDGTVSFRRQVLRQRICRLIQQNWEKIVLLRLLNHLIDLIIIIPCEHFLHKPPKPRTFLLLIERSIKDRASFSNQFSSLHLTKNFLDRVTVPLIDHHGVPQCPHADR